MTNSIRILHILGGMNMGGIENFIMNIYRNIDRNKIQFDFLIHQQEKQIFEDEILSLGGKVYRISSFGKVGHFKYLKKLREFFLAHKEYKIVHSHYNAVSGIILKEAKKCGIKNRIAHSHIAYPKYKFIEGIYKSYSKFWINLNANKKFACSKMAGEWLYGKNVKFNIINNGIETEKYFFCKEKRNEIRKELGINQNEFSLISIGRLVEQKNFEFILEVMKIVQMKEKNIKLYIIGEGELERDLKAKIKLDKINNVIFLGVRKNINEILNAMDLMLFPSLYEGLGIVAIEAQCNGLKVLASENVPKEADMNLNLYEELTISDKNIWVNKILEEKKILKRNQTKLDKDKIKNSNYNIRKIVQELEKIYLMMENSNE